MRPLIVILPVVVLFIVCVLIFRRGGYRWIIRTRIRMSCIVTLFATYLIGFMIDANYRFSKRLQNNLAWLAAHAESAKYDMVRP